MDDWSWAVIIKNGHSYDRPIHRGTSISYLVYGSLQEIKDDDDAQMLRYNKKIFV